MKFFIQSQKVKKKKGKKVKKRKSEKAKMRKSEKVKKRNSDKSKIQKKYKRERTTGLKYFSKFRRLFEIEPTLMHSS